MLIGIPKEVKNNEFRVGATPAMVRVLVEAGHYVLVETHAGTKIGFTDEMYKAAGAKIVKTEKEVFDAEMIIKVKELQTQEFKLLRPNQILFCYLHLAPDPKQTKQLLQHKVVGIAYETVTDAKGRLPLLIPMSEMAGRIAVQVGANYLQLNNGGKGIVLGGVPGVPPGEVVILGGGVLGTESARMALGLGANVTIIDKNIHRLRALDCLFGPSLKTVYSTTSAIEELVPKGDLVIGAVLIPGKTAPKLITKATIAKMSPGSVFIDPAIDQGGCSETSRPTTHGSPTYLVHDVIHYCVTNMPGACAKTATLALTNATLEYALTLANKGYRRAMQEDPYLRAGLNVCQGKVTNLSVANDLGQEYVPPESFI